MKQPKKSKVVFHQLSNSGMWCVSIVTQCNECGDLLFMQLINLHGDAGPQLVVCPACIKKGWRPQPKYAAEHPEVANLFNASIAKVGKKRAPRAALHEHSALDQDLVDKLATRVISLSMSTRLDKAIARHNAEHGGSLHYVLDLVQMEEREVSAVRGIGQACLREVKKILARMELQLGMRLDQDTLKAARALIAQRKRDSV